MLTKFQTALDGVVTPLTCKYHPNADDTVCAVYSAVQWIESNPDTVNLIAILILIPITVSTLIAVYDTFTRD